MKDANRTHFAAEDQVNRVIGLKEAGKLLSCSYSTMLRIANSGDLLAFRVRGAWRTTTSACREYINEQFARQRAISQSTEVLDGKERK